MYPSWEQIRKSSLLFEDSDILVLNKPTGIAVVGSSDKADLVSLAQEAGEKLFPAHRIDKETSGAILLAKSLRAHGMLARQFTLRSINKAYLAISKFQGMPTQGIIDLPLSEGRKKRVRVAAKRADITINEEGNYWSVVPTAIFNEIKNYPSITTFARVWEGEERTLLIAKPLTGRRHQIRVHLAWIGHPIVGDPLFGRGPAEHTERMLLHSWRLGFKLEWSTGKDIELVAEPGSDFWDATFHGCSDDDTRNGLEVTYSRLNSVDVFHPG